MPNNKKRSLKDIKGERIHPYSRKASQMQRALLRQDKMAHKKTVIPSRLLPIIEKMQFFKAVLPDEWTTVTLQQLHQLASEFSDRHREEILEIQTQQRPGRPMSSKIGILQAAHEAAKEEYRAGMEIPDLSDAETLRLLRAWEGDINCLNLFRLIRIREADRPTDEMPVDGEAASSAEDSKK